MSALLVTLVVAFACPEEVRASVDTALSRASTLRGEALAVKSPKERERILAEVDALDQALATLRADLGCVHAGPSTSRPVGSAPERKLTVLDAAETRALVSVILGERFDDVRLAALESGLVGRCVDPASARVLLDAFPAGNARQDAWRKVAPRVTDRQGATLLVERIAGPAGKQRAARALELAPIDGCVAAPTDAEPAEPVDERAP